MANLSNNSDPFPLEKEKETKPKTLWQTFKESQEKDAKSWFVEILIFRPVKVILNAFVLTAMIALLCLPFQLLGLLNMNFMYDYILTPIVIFCSVVTIFTGTKMEY